MDSVLSFGRKTFASLAIRNYRLYFIGQGISLSGSWMQTVALGWLALEVTGSGSQLGLVTALQFVPILFFGPYGGVIADRFDKRIILYWTQSASGVLAAILSVVVLLGLTKLWMLYAFALASGAVRLFDNPTRNTFVSELVGNDNLKNAISLNSMANNLARAIGPTIGGVLIAVFGIAFCFLFNALSYIACLVTIYMMDKRTIVHHERTKQHSGEFFEGLHYIRAHPLIRNTLLMMAVVGTFAYEFQVTLPILAQQTFVGTAADYATLMAAFGVGSVIGGIFAAGRHAIAPHQLSVAMFFFGISILGTALAPSLQVATLGMVIVGVFSINVLSLGNTMIQLESEPGMRGRVMALWSVAMIGSTPVGGPIVGWIGEHIGARYGLVVGGLAAVATAAYAYFFLFKRDIEQKVEMRADVEAEEVGIETLKAR